MRVEILDKVLDENKLTAITTRDEALKWGDAWQAHAERMEMLYDIARIHRDCSDALLAFAEGEILRLNEILQKRGML